MCGTFSNYIWLLPYLGVHDICQVCDILTVHLKHIFLIYLVNNINLRVYIQYSCSLKWAFWHSKEKPMSYSQRVLWFLIVKSWWAQLKQLPYTIGTPYRLIIKMLHRTENLQGGNSAGGAVKIMSTQLT